MKCSRTLLLYASYIWILMFMYSYVRTLKTAPRVWDLSPKGNKNLVLLLDAIQIQKKMAIFWFLSSVKFSITLQGKNIIVVSIQEQFKLQKITSFKVESAPVLDPVSVGPLSWSNWNLEMLVLVEVGQEEYPKKSTQSRRTTDIWSESNPGHPGWRWPLSALSHPSSPNNAVTLCIFTCLKRSDRPNSTFATFSKFAFCAIFHEIVVFTVESSFLW